MRGTGRAPALDRAIDAVFLLTMPLLAWLAVFGHRGAAVVAGVSAIAIALRPSIWREGLPLVAPSRVAAAPLPRAALAGLFFTAWIAVTGIWSPAAGAWKLSLGVAAFVLAGGALVFEASRAGGTRLRRLCILFAGAVAIASAALLFEGFTGGLLRAIVPPADQSPLRLKDMTALARGVTLIAPLVFPAAAIILTMTGSRALAAAPIAFALLAAAQFSVVANVVALFAAGAAATAAYFRPRPVIVGLGALFLASMLAAPLFVLAPADAVTGADAALMPPSWAQRLHLWKEAAARIFSCLPVGCGADYTRAWAGEGTMIEVPGWPLPVQEAPTHPHNLFLQVWLELGLPGVLSLCAALYFGMRRLAAIEPQRLAFAAIAGVAAATYISFMLEASMWQAWRIAVLALAAFGGALSYSCQRQHS